MNTISRSYASLLPYTCSPKERDVNVGLDSDQSRAFEHIVR